MARIVMEPIEEEYNLRKIVSMLNDDEGPEMIYDAKGQRRKNYEPRHVVRLRRLVRAWSDMMLALRDSGPDITKMKLTRKDREELEHFTKNLQVRHERDGSRYLVDYYPSPEDEALVQFTRLLNNSQRDRLGGPCPNIRKGNKPCNKWFIKKTKREAVFCSTRCAGNAMQARKRKRVREEMIKRAQEAINEYPKRAACWKELDWKTFAVEAGFRVSKKFLTECVGSGELTAPEEGRLTARKGAR